MDFQRLRITAEAYGIRLRTKVRLVFQFAGLLLVLIGAYNMLMGGEVFEFYRTILPFTTRAQPFGGDSYTLIHVSDVVVMAIGAAVAWWS